MKDWLEGVVIMACFICSGFVGLVCMPVGFLFLFLTTVWANMFSQRVNTVEGREQMIARSKREMTAALKCNPTVSRAMARSAYLN